MTNTVTVDRSMAELLKSCFEVDEIRDFARHVDEKLFDRLPSGNVSRDKLANALVAQARQRGLLGDDFFLRWKEERPGRTREIEGVRELHVAAMRSAPSPPSIPETDRLARVWNLPFRFQVFRESIPPEQSLDELNGFATLSKFKDGQLAVTLFDNSLKGPSPNPVGVATVFSSTAESVDSLPPAFNQLPKDMFTLGGDAYYQVLRASQKQSRLARRLVVALLTALNDLVTYIELPADVTLSKKQAKRREEARRLLRLSAAEMRLPGRSSDPTSTSAPTPPPTPPIAPTLPAAASLTPPMPTAPLPAPPAASHTTTLHIDQEHWHLFDDRVFREDRPEKQSDPKPIAENKHGVKDWTNTNYQIRGKSYPLGRTLQHLPTDWSRADVEAFGNQLATHLFGPNGPSDEVKDRFRVPAGQTHRLMLVLSKDAMAVPWEYLRIDNRFLVEHRVSIVRHVDVKGAVAQSTQLAQKVDRIVVAVANPHTRTESVFDASAHLNELMRGLRPAIQVEPIYRATKTELHQILGHSKARGFHFLGHGRQGSMVKEAELVLHCEHDPASRHLSGVTPPNADSPRLDDGLPASQLAVFLGKQARDFVFLEACHSGGGDHFQRLVGMAWEIVRTTGIPVISMQMAVPQAFATKFASDFYKNLKMDLEQAVYESRSTPHDGRCAFGIPVLYADMRAELRPPAPTKDWDGKAHFQVVHRVELTMADAVDAWKSNEHIAPAVRNLVLRGLAAEQAARSHTDSGGPGDSTALDAASPSSEPTLAVPPDQDDEAELLRRLTVLEHQLQDSKAKAQLRQVRELLEPPPPLPPSRVPAPTQAHAHAPIHRENDRSLKVLKDAKHVDKAATALQSKYSFSDGLIPRIVGELQAGRHVLLTGPVGTGKTTLARAVTELVFGYEAFIQTASADWTSFEVIGGFWPQPSADGQGVQFTFRNGAFLQGVMENWSQRASSKGTCWRRVERGGKKGRWLILDELNRADMDRAMGALFTAMESGEISVPVSGDASGTLSARVPIPQDFRIIATINLADRHYLFRLSDALKRRFAFVHVPVTPDWNDEWKKLREVPVREGIAPEKWWESDPHDVVSDLRRFVYLTRVFHPLGSALFLAALRFVAASGSLASSTGSHDWRLHQAIAGSILPNLEDLPKEPLTVLQAWAAGDGLLAALTAALPNPGGNQQVSRAIAALNALDPWEDSAAPNAPEVQKLATLLQRSTNTSQALLEEQLTEMVSRAVHG